MKYPLIGTVLALLVLASCSQERELPFEEPAEVVASTGNTVHFTTDPFETKAAFGEAETGAGGAVTYPCYWTAADTQVKISLNYEYAVVADVNAEETDGSGHITRASFDASFDDIDTTNPYTFYLVSPASAFLWASPGRESVSVNISSNQTPTAASADEAAMVLVAKSSPYTSIPADVNVSFHHITSYGKLTLTGVVNNPLFPEGETVTSVTLLTQDEPVSGTWYYYLSDGSVAEKEGACSIVINTTGINVLGGDPVWFAAAPASLAGKQLTVKVTFSDGSFLHRTVTLNNDFVLSSGKVTKFSVNMASAEGSTPPPAVFSPVTSLNDIAEGDEIIIMDSGKTRAMSSSLSGSNDFEMNEGNVTPGSGVVKLTVNSLSGSTLTLSEGERYLGVSSSQLGFFSQATDWTLSFKQGASYLNSGKYYIDYSSSFKVTKLSMGSAPSISLYKHSPSVIPGASQSGITVASVTSYNQYGAYLGATRLLYGNTTDQIIREYSSDGSTLSFSIIDPAADKLVTVSGIDAEAGLGNSFTIGLRYVSGSNVVLNKTFNVTVVKEEGHTLWLADGDDNGFIVKK